MCKTHPQAFDENVPIVKSKAKEIDCRQKFSTASFCTAESVRQAHSGVKHVTYYVEGEWKGNIFVVL